MRCPLCKDVPLQQTSLETELLAFACPGCQGIWIASSDYQAWLKAHPTTLLEKPTAEAASPPVFDTQQAKLCPGCGHILSRYKIWPDLDLYLDRCGHCNGVWFDRNEWQMLVAHNLNDKLHMFFTRPWQKKLREQETRKRLDRIYAQRFGQEDYAKLQETRAWLDQHPQKSLLLAYLTDPDPYKV